jgi:phosphoribosylglycinamide formyltransferase 1
MRLGVITYQERHLKTEQVCLGLARTRSCSSMTFFALPFQARPPRKVLFEHRPDMLSGAHTRELANFLQAKYEICDSANAIPADGADLFLILGAGLLPSGFVAETRGRVLNSHPGIIPAVRGLDAFKWAIYDLAPVGNTLHFIDEEADAGETIAILPTPVFASDSLRSFARRHYELEIAMMVGFADYLDRRPEQDGRSSLLEPRPARMRMPAEKQAELETRFELYKKEFAHD